MRVLFRTFRIITLLLIFIALAFYTKTQKLKSRTWSEPLQIIIYPMNSENNIDVEEYINQLDSHSFKAIDQFFQSEAEHYSLSIQKPITTALGETLRVYPPAAPHPDSNVVSIIIWGLKFRYWAYKNTPDDQSNLHRVRVFVHYHEVKENVHLQHSLGLDKGLLSIVHAFASKQQEPQNNIVIAHELLHTVGATDKYNAMLQPVFPDGYAEPDNIPLFPQSQAEIMSAKIPLSADHSRMADSLDQCIIGDKTAIEINWPQANYNE